MNKQLTDDEIRALIIQERKAEIRKENALYIRDAIAWGLWTIGLVAWTLLLSVFC